LSSHLTLATASALLAAGASLLTAVPAGAPTGAPSRAQGREVFPLAGQAEVRGGGREYRYDVAGHTVTYTTPPASFDPLTAPSRQLARYGIPSEPKGGTARAAWRSDMARLHFVKAPPYLAMVAAHAGEAIPDYSDHWAGYVAFTGPYRRAAASWSQPVVKTSLCRSGALTLWAGLGGYAAISLAQAGTSVGTPGVGRGQAWWEITPAGMVPVPLYASAGGKFTAEVRYVGHDRFAFFMENDVTGASWSQTESGGRPPDLTTAEVIAERPCLDKCNGDEPTYARLPDFGSVDFRSSSVDGAALGTYSTYAENMTTTPSSFGAPLAQPGPFSSHKASFTVKQDRCG
jgi:Peptidase A4 family